MKVAAYQAPLLESARAETIARIREQVNLCERAGVAILCCPEGVLGGLADYSTRPRDIAIDVQGGELDEVLRPLASSTVTTIVGFTELDGRTERLFNSAAVFHRGAVVGLYRKLHPAINRSVYEPGEETPVFTIGGLTFGILICRDSSHVQPARVLARRGATALFVPTNNGLPASRGGPELPSEARNVDIARARENRVAMIRADVAGRTANLISHGSSGIVDPEGVVLASAEPFSTGILVADLAPGARARR